jgi:hypothetical protein
VESVQAEVYFDLGAGWVKNNDVLQKPPPTWEYGIRGDAPTDLMAGTGVATFYLDNSHSNGSSTPGLYSPDHASLLSGFGEGTKCKIQLPGTTWLQRYFSAIGAFDAVTPTWDGEVNEVADFDAETDADGDLNDSADAARHGATGLEITFDDNNAAYGRIDLAAVNQTEVVAVFSLNLNDLVALPVGKILDVCEIQDGAGVDIGLFRVQGTATPGQVWMIYYARNDAAGYENIWIDTFTIQDAWHDVVLYLKMSSGVGADDGVARVWRNGILEGENDAIDNDTYDMDYANFGMTFSNAAAWGGSYYLDCIRFDTVGAPYDHVGAAYRGTHGLAFPIMETTARYLTFSDPTNETTYVTELWLDPNTLAMTAGDEFVIVRCRGSGAGNDFFYLTLAMQSSTYKVRIYYDTDVGSGSGSYHALVDGWNHIRVEAVASSAPAADDGSITIYIDGDEAEEITGIDNDGHDADECWYGAVEDLDAGTYGLFYMDGIRWGNTLTKVKFHGRIAAIRPDADLFGDPAVEVEAHDWIGYLAGQELGLQSVGTTKRADEALTTALTDFPIQPEATDFDNGVETFMLVFNTDNPETSMASFFNKMCRNELGRCYLLGDGTLRFEHRNARANDVTEQFVLDGTMTELDVAYKRRDIYNIISARITVMEATPTADVLLWDLKVAEYFGGEIPSIAAGETIVFRCPFTDPTNGVPIAAMNVVDPITHVEFGSVGDFETNDMIGDLDIDQVIGANMTEVTMENEHLTNTGYLNDLQIYGRGILVYGTTTLYARDTTSINSGVGERRFRLRLEHITDDARAQAYADHVLSQVKNARLAPIRVRVLANQDPLLLAELINAEVSQRFTLSESATGIDEDFFINNLKYIQDGQQLWVVIEAGPATRYAGVLS